MKPEDVFWYVRLLPKLSEGFIVKTKEAGSFGTELHFYQTEGQNIPEGTFVSRLNKD